MPLTNIPPGSQVNLPFIVYIYTSRISCLLEDLRQAEVGVPLLSEVHKPQISKASCEYLDARSPYEGLLTCNKCVCVHGCCQTIVPKIIFLGPIPPIQWLCSRSCSYLCRGLDWIFLVLRTTPHSSSNCYGVASVLWVEDLEAAIPK